MRRTWQVRRTTSEQPDGQARWDQAYQLLLRWRLAAEPPEAKEGAMDASSVVCAGVDRAAAARPNYRTATCPTTGLCGGSGGVDRRRRAHLPRRRLQRRQARSARPGRIA